MDYQAKINELEQENAMLKEELKLTKEHLKRYTAPVSSKVYYEKHKEEQKQRVRLYKETTGYKPTPQQKKEYNKQAYLRRKEKLKKEMEETQHNESI